MADDEDLDFDPDDLGSIVAWSRRERLRGLSTYGRQEEPTPKPAPRQKRLTDAQAASQLSQQWADYIDERIWAVADKIAEVIGQETALNENKLRDQLRREIQQAIDKKPKVIVYDPSEAMKKQIMEFSEGLREELREIKRELGLARKDVIDLPAWRKKA